LDPRCASASSVLKEWMSSPALQLYYPANRHPPAALRSFIALLREVAKQTGAAQSARRTE
jgi:DNA-binding transcriptional LysR family regulator